MRNTFLLEIDFTLNPDKRREFNSSLTGLVCMDGGGNVRTSVYEDRDERNRFLWVAECANREVLEQYLESDAYRELLGCIKTLGKVADSRVVEPANEEAAEVPASFARVIIPRARSAREA